MTPAFPLSDHCDGQRFFNLPGGLEERSFSALPRWWWQQLTQGQRSAWPRQVALSVTPTLPSAVPAGQIAVTFVGHSTFLLQWPEFNLLTDPIFSSHAGPFGRLGLKRVRSPALSLEQLPRIDAVVLSHNHYDHLDLAALREVTRKHRSQVITTLGNKTWLEARGVVDVVELDWWETHRPLPAFEVTCTPAQHFAARLPWDRNRTLWGGFALKTPRGSVYFTGDSGWFGGFAEIGARLGPFDVGLIPIGAYAPRWFMAPIHMNPEEAVQAHRAVKARRSLGMHFGTFQLTDEAIDAPLKDLAEARTKHGTAKEEFDTLEFGETRFLTV